MGDITQGMVDITDNRERHLRSQKQKSENSPNERMISPLPN